MGDLNRGYRVYDVTVPIRQSMPIWPGDPGFERSLVYSIARGDMADVSMLKMGSHTGTHVDAPSHFSLDDASVDELPVDILTGCAVVFELDAKKQISRADVEKLDLTGCERVLFKTKNSSLWESNEFTPDFVSFAPDAAEYLIEKGVKLVGIDYLSVAAYKDGTVVHRIFLESRVIIIEGLDLSAITPGEYELLCLPLKIQGADGAPARVLLREIDVT